MSKLVLNGDTSGSVTLDAPAVSGTTTLTLPTTTGTLVVTSGSQTIEFADGSASAPSITNSGDTNTGMFFPAADTIAFAEGGTEAMRLDSVGNVGIGNTAPNTRLHVQGGTNADGSLTYNQQLTSTAAFNASPATGTLVSLQFNSGGSYAGMGGWSVNKENATDGNFAGYMAFHTRANGGSTTERMRIDSSGNVNIGQSSAFGAGIRTTIKAADTSSQSLALISAVTSGTGTLQYLVDGSNDVCGFIGINATANTTSYNTSSDYRLKENIVPMTGALDKVQALKPVFWNWKHAPEIIGQGFIAHELQAVIPDAVSGEKDAVDEEGNPKYQGVDTSFLVAILTAAIQEQQIIIETLKTDIAALKAKVGE